MTPLVTSETCEKCEAVETKPSPQPLVDTAAFLFRRGTTSSEKDMRPDGTLVYEMRDRKLRVQDILDATIGPEFTTDEVASFLIWYKNNKGGEQE